MTFDPKDRPDRVQLLDDGKAILRAEETTRAGGIAAFDCAANPTNRLEVR